MSDERWLPVVGYEDSYEVSDRGDVRSVDRIDAAAHRWRGRPLQLRMDRHGYWKAYLSSKGQTRGFFCHRLVLTAFKGSPPFERAEAAHLDGSRANNSPDNLMWATRKENSDHMKLHGTSRGAVGEANSSAKLTVDAVRRIKESSLFGARQIDLAAIHGVSPSAIGLIARGVNWPHLGNAQQSVNSNVLSKVLP